MKYFFGFLALIAAIVVVILLATGLFRSPASSTLPIREAYALKDEKAVESIVRYTVTGPVTADESYREVRITISKNVRTIEVLKGYGKTVEKTATIPNNPEAYKAFLGALAAARYAIVRDGDTTDLRSTCVTGQKYFYELQQGSDKKIDTWSSSCSTAQGNFAGNAPATAQLFRAQIPNYNEVTAGVALSL